MFIPEIGEYGQMCSINEMAKGLIFMFLIFTIWSAYVIKTLRSENMDMLSLNTGSIKNIAANSKNLALSTKKREFDAIKMHDDQRKMFILL